jgi:hypothetical protein
MTYSVPNSANAGIDASYCVLCVPVALLIILLVLYIQFGKFSSAIDGFKIDLELPVSIKSFNFGFFISIYGS